MFWPRLVRSKSNPSWNYFFLGPTEFGALSQIYIYNILKISWFILWKMWGFFLCSISGWAVGGVRMSAIVLQDFYTSLSLFFSLFFFLSDLATGPGPGPLIEPTHTWEDGSISRDRNLGVANLATPLSPNLIVPLKLPYVWWRLIPPYYI